MKNDHFTISAFKVSQPIGDFYVSKIPYQIITSCATAEPRKVIDEQENRSGIQRELSSVRVREIKEFVKTIDATFPNSVILNLNNDYEFKGFVIENNIEGFENSDNTYLFNLEKHTDTFKIIDGQHRIEGLKQARLGENGKDFDIVCSFYIDLPLSKQAYIFSTINSKQINVNKSLVMDLFELSEYHTPEKCAHLITVSLNSDNSSPLYQRISLLGKAPEYENDVMYKTVLTQGTVSRRILDLISKRESLNSDNDTIKNGKMLTSNVDNIKNGLVFRNFFINGEDKVIYKILINFFNAVREAFSEEWNDLSNPISRTIGFSALMSFFVDVMKYGESEKDFSFNFFNGIMDVVRNNYVEDHSNKLNFEVYPASGVGETKLYKNLLMWSRINQFVKNAVTSDDNPSR